MNPQCILAREELLEGGPAEPPAEEHARACAECAAWLARHRLRLEALAALPRLVAPASLERCVAEALEPAHRRERVLRLLASGARPAPAVLDRLVAEELRDLEKSHSRRFLGKLSRLRAPLELAPRAADAAAAQRSPGAGALGAPSRSSVWTGVAVLAAAAGLAGVLLLRALRPESGPSARYSFAVERVDSLAAFSPLARSLIEGTDAAMLAREGM